MADFKPKYQKTAIASFKFFSDKKMDGADQYAALSFDMMNGNYRIQVTDGKKLKEGEKFKPWMTLRLGALPWATFIGALVTVARPSAVIKKIPIVIMDVERDWQGRPVRADGPSKKVEQCTLWVGLDSNDVFFLAVQETKTGTIVKFPIRPSIWAETKVIGEITEQVASSITMTGLVNYLPGLSAICSQATLPDNPGRGVGGVGGNAAPGDRPKWQGNNDQKKPWQGNNNGGGNNYKKKPYNGGNNNGGGGNYQSSNNGYQKNNSTPQPASAEINDIPF